MSIVKPVPTWRLWWKKYSTWLSLSIPALAIAQQALPSLQAIVPDETYKVITGVLGFVIVIAVNIRQKSVSGEVPK